MAVSNSQMRMALSSDELRFQAQYIRDTVAPTVNCVGLCHPGKLHLVIIQDIFTALESTSVTVSILEHSRIEKALLEICKEGTNWPDELVKKAEERLQAWTYELGDISNLKPQLWCIGGGMHDIDTIESEPRLNKLGKAAKVLGFEETVEEPKWRWLISPNRKEEPQMYGHHGFEVGDWWIEPICAARDGIIDRSLRPITAGKSGAYAVLLRKNDAVDQDDGTIMYKYIYSSKGDDGHVSDARAFLRNVTSREPIRVLRASKLESKLAPRAGVRYDGLYRVVRQGIGRTNGRMSLWFEFAREADQPSLIEALKRPRADEYEDWEHFQALEAELGQSKLEKDYPYLGGEDVPEGFDVISTEYIISSNHGGIDTVSQWP